MSVLVLRSGNPELSRPWRFSGAMVGRLPADVEENGRGSFREGIATALDAAG